MSSPLSFIEISSEALRHNISAIKKYVGDNQHTFAVVKGNAYGHGLSEIVRAIDPLIDGFQVDDIEELRALRAETTKRILVLGFVQQSDLKEAVELDGELALYDSERLHVLRKLERPVRVHIKIDALLGRQGLLVSALPAFLEELKQAPSLTIAGVYSHFSNLEDTESHEHADAQLAMLEEALRLFEQAGFTSLPTHISSTAGILTFEGSGSSRSLVRLGIGLYGLAPSSAIVRTSGVELTPALRWVSHLAQVKDIPTGYPVGYGLSFIAPQAMRIAIVPQGYSDGYDRGFSNTSSVLVQGTRCPVIGRVAMNMFAIDVSHIDAKPGDEVVLLGNQGNETVTADELAELGDTINYEIVTRISPLLPRTLLP